MTDRDIGKTADGGPPTAGSSPGQYVNRLPSAVSGPRSAVSPVRIAVGSTNPVKLDSVREAAALIFESEAVEVSPVAAEPAGARGPGRAAGGRHRDRAGGRHRRDRRPAVHLFVVRGGRWRRADPARLHLALGAARPRRRPDPGWPGAWRCHRSGIWAGQCEAAGRRGRDRHPRAVDPGPGPGAGGAAGPGGTAVGGVNSECRMQK